MSELSDPVPLTAEYTPTLNFYAEWLLNPNRKHFVAGRDVPQMLCDPDIAICLWWIYGPIWDRARFFVDCDDSRVKQFIVDNVTRFWRTSVTKALQSVEWGWTGTEVMYRRNKDGMDSFDRLLPHIAPQDVRPRSIDGRLSSVIVKGGKSGEVRLGGMKGFWCVHGRKFNPWWGRSRLYAAFPPFTETWTPDGAKDMRRLFYHKYAFRDGIARYPIGRMFPLPDGTEISGYELLRRAVEKWKTGGTLFLPWQSPESPQFEVLPPEVQPPPVGLEKYIEDLRDEKWRGIGVPRELIMSGGEGGSGYAGRQVPQIAFYSSLQEIVNYIITDADQQIFNPLVKMNFGESIYDIVAFPLTKPTENEVQDSEPEQPMQGGEMPPPGQADQQFAFSSGLVRDRSELRGNGTCFWRAA